MIPFIYFLQGEDIEGWDWSEWKAVSAIKASHGCRDLPAPGSAANIANSLWTFLMSVCSQSIWASYILSITWSFYRNSQLCHSFWGSNSLLSALGGEWGWLGKAVQAVNVRNFSLDTSVLSTPLPPLSCLCSQLFVLVLKKTPTILNCTTNHCTCPQGAINATLLIPYFFNNPIATARNNDVNTSISVFSIMIKAMPVTIKVTIWWTTDHRPPQASVTNTLNIGLQLGQVTSVVWEMKSILTPVRNERNEHSPSATFRWLWVWNAIFSCL